MPYNALKTYQKTSAEGADILRLVIMCYDATIEDLKQAKKFHDAKDMTSAYAKIRHAQDIITELLVGLDYEQGGEIARNLSRLYNFSLRRLIGVNSRESSDVYDIVIHIMGELKDAYEQIRDKVAPSTAAGAPSTRSLGVSV